MITVALDGRGAERGSEAIVAGARAAAADGIRLRVFGDPGELASLEEVEGAEVLAAPAEITNAEEPVAAVRSRPEASVVMAARDVAEGQERGPAAAKALALTWMVERVCYQQIVRGASVDDPQLVDALVEIWERSVYGSG